MLGLRFHASWGMPGASGGCRIGVSGPAAGKPPLDRGRRAPRSRDLRGRCPHPQPGARRRDEPPVARRRLLAPLVHLRRAARACRGKDRPPRGRPGAGFARGHRGGGQHRGQAARAAATPGPSGGRGPTRAPRADAELARPFPPGTPPPPLRSRPASATSRRRPPSRCARSPPWSPTRASTPACTTRPTCWRAALIGTALAQLTAHIHSRASGAGAGERGGVL